MTNNNITKKCMNNSITCIININDTGITTKHGYLCSNCKEKEIANCEYCQTNKDDNMMPSHFPSSYCMSGGKIHCTCGTCY